MLKTRLYSAICWDRYAKNISHIQNVTVDKIDTQRHFIFVIYNPAEEMTATHMPKAQTLRLVMLTQLLEISLIKKMSLYCTDTHLELQLRKIKSNIETELEIWSRALISGEFLMDCNTKELTLASCGNQLN